MKWDSKKLLDNWKFHEKLIFDLFGREKIEDDGNFKSLGIFDSRKLLIPLIFGIFNYLAE